MGVFFPQHQRQQVTVRSVTCFVCGLALDNSASVTAKVGSVSYGELKKCYPISNTVAGSPSLPASQTLSESKPCSPWSFTLRSPGPSSHPETSVSLWSGSKHALSSPSFLTSQNYVLSILMKLEPSLVFLLYAIQGHFSMVIINSAWFTLSILDSENSSCQTLCGTDLQNIFPFSLNQFHVIRELVYSVTVKPNCIFPVNNVFSS